MEVGRPWDHWKHYINNFNIINLKVLAYFSFKKESTEVSVGKTRRPFKKYTISNLVLAFDLFRGQFS